MPSNHYFLVAVNMEGKLSFGKRPGFLNVIPITIQDMEEFNAFSSNMLISFHENTVEVYLNDKTLTYRLPVQIKNFNDLKHQLENHIKTFGELPLKKALDNTDKNLKKHPYISKPVSISKPCAYPPIEQNLIKSLGKKSPMRAESTKEAYHHEESKEADNIRRNKEISNNSKYRCLTFFICNSSKPEQKPSDKVIQNIHPIKNAYIPPPSVENDLTNNFHY